jgi:hypothetical protein
MKCHTLLKQLVVLDIQSSRNAGNKHTLTLCCFYLNPYCLGRKTEFLSGYLNLHAKPETGIPYREKNYNN